MTAGATRGQYGDAGQVAPAAHQAVVLLARSRHKKRLDDRREELRREHDGGTVERPHVAWLLRGVDLLSKSASIWPPTTKDRPRSSARLPRPVVRTSSTASRLNSSVNRRRFLCGYCSSPIGHPPLNGGVLRVEVRPGRKTDVCDAAWLAELLEHGLLRGSFMPPAPIRELRGLTCYRKRPGPGPRLGGSAYPEDLGGRRHRTRLGRHRCAGCLGSGDAGRPGRRAARRWGAGRAGQWQVAGQAVPATTVSSSQLFLSPELLQHVAGMSSLNSISGGWASLRG